MKTRLDFELDVMNAREVGPYYTPLWDLFINGYYLGKLWGFTDSAMKDRFSGRDGETIVSDILHRQAKYSHA